MGLSNYILNPTTGSEKNEKSAEQFVRVESKFFIPRTSVRALESLLTSYLAPVDATKGANGFTRVESHYFETPDLTFFTDSLKKPQQRMKMRVRKYFDSGTLFSGCFIEIKSKDNGISKKKRFRIGDWEEKEILKGQPIPLTARLESINYNLRRETLLSRLNKVNELILNQHPQYAVRVIYDRRAFEGQNLRVTVDQNLQSEIIYSFLPVLKNNSRQILSSNYWSVGEGMRRSFNGNDFVVVEVKHPGVTPTWLNAGFKSLMAGQDISFSKYVWSVSEALSALECC